MNSKKMMRKTRSTSNRHTPNDLNNYDVNSLKLTTVMGILGKEMVKICGLYLSSAQIRNR